MFVLSHSIRHLFNNINIQVNSKQLILQSKFKIEKKKVLEIKI